MSKPPINPGPPPSNFPHQQNFNRPAPGPRPAPKIIKKPKPPAILYFKIFCAANVLFYFGVIGLAFLFFAVGNDPAAAASPEDAMAATFMGFFLLGFGPLMAILYGVGIFLERGRGAWVYGMVLIAISLTGICILAGVPMLIFWLQPPVREHFDKQQRRR